MNDALKLIGLIAICWFLQIWKFFDFAAISTWTGYDLATENLDKATTYTKDRLNLNSQPSQMTPVEVKLDIDSIKKTCADNQNYSARIKQKYIDAYLDLAASGQQSKSILVDTQSANYRFCIRKDGGFVFISENEDNGVIAFLQNRKPVVLRPSDKKI